MTWAARNFRLIRPLAILVLPMLLFACAPKLQPLGPVVTTPAFGADRLVMDDGVALPLRHWPAEGKTKAVVLAVHGFNDYSHAFEQPAQDWAKLGIETYAFDQRGFGATQVAPLRDARHDVVLDRDLPEEVVRGEEREVAAEVAVAAHDVVLVRGHVLVMPGEHDQRVRLGERLPVADAAELGVRKVVDVTAGRGQPPDERRVVLLPVRRDAAVEKRPDETRRVLLPARIPSVGMPVAVVVAEVVRLPGLGRHHDGDAMLAEPPRAEDERRIADAGTRRRELREVHAALP